MTKFFTLIGILAILFGASFIVGCDESNPNNPIVQNSGDVNSLELRLQYNGLKGFEGEQRTIEVTAIALNSSGSALRDVSIDFGIVNPLPWKGSIARVDEITNENGESKANYSVVLSQTGRVTIQVSSGLVSKTANVELELVDDVLDTLYLATSRRIFQMQPQQTKSATITATLVDTADNPVTNMLVNFRLDQPNLGTLDADTGMTNQNGQVIRSYSYTAGDQILNGTVNVIATVGNLRSSIPIEVRPVATAAKIWMTPVDTSLYVASNQSASMDITVVVVDEGGVGVSGSPVKFELRPDPAFGADTLFGSLTPRDTTDENGQVIVSFHSRGGQGHLILKATVLPSGLAEDDGNEISTEVRLNVIMSEGGETGELVLNSDVDYIYADQGVTYARVRAVLKDQNNQALAGRPVIFTSNNNGAISSPVTTDSLGIALASFSDVGLPSVNAVGEREPCDVHAIYEPLGLDVRISIDIRPPELVDNITLATGKNVMGAGSGDSTWVRATCFLNEDRSQLAPIGTFVNFEVEQGMGSFVNSQVSVGAGGVAETAYIVGNQVGQAALRAFVVNEVDGQDVNVYSNEVYIDLIPGAPADISVTAAPSVLRIGEVGEQSMVIATVIDSFGNPVRDGSVLVQFTTTLGTVDPPSTPTDTGRAVGMLRPGVEAGVAIITAAVQTPSGEITAQTAVSFIAGGGSSIQLSATPLEISVAGGGANSQSTLRASVRDANGNLVEVPTRVVFELVTNDVPPAACNINDNTPFDADTSSTSNGVAVATLNSGRRVGPQLIRAFTLDPNGQRTGVQAILSTVMVVAGPPASLDIDVNDIGTDVGGGTWEILVSCRVYDDYRNPVADLIPVVFNILEEDLATIQPGFTGNNPGGGDPVAGMAYAQMTYNSNNTFDPVTIQAYCRTEDIDSVGGELEHILPLQEGVLDLNIDPTNHMADDNDYKDTRVWAILVDGHGILIDNAPILFGANRGTFWYDRGGQNRPNFEPYNPNPVRRLTGEENDGETANARLQDDDPRGHAVVWHRGRGGPGADANNDFFLDPFTAEVTVQIEASVEGYNDVTADPAFLFITRHP